MNVENILKVADAIEQHSVPGLAFHLDYTYERVTETGINKSPDVKRMGKGCNAVACIIGWTNSVIPSGAPLSDGHAAGRTLGFEDWPKAAKLFYPDDEFDWPNLSYGKVTPEQAVRVLRHLAATGEVDWSL